MTNPFEAYLFRGRSTNLTNISRTPTQIIEVDEDDFVWTSPPKQQAPPTGPPVPLATAALSQRSDDDLLVGKAPTPTVAVAKKREAEKPPLPSKRMILISQLPWSAKLSNDRREKIIDVFQAQFCNYLLDNPVTYKTFGPFVSSKYVDRHADPSVCLESAPVIDATHIRCQPGNALRHYQVDGVRFLLDNFHKGMSSIMADDMGLGKTAQVCSFLQLLNTLYGIKGPHLIVVPLTTITNWVRELARWAPSLQVLKYHGSKEYRANCGFATDHRHSVIITTPTTLVNDKETLRARAWGVVMVDEAHSLKNDSTNIVSVCSRLTAVMRISITGTPFQNTLNEMWTQMSFLFPYIAKKRFDFDDEDDDVAAAEMVKKLLSYIMIRRTKTQMDLGLPPRVDEPTMMIEPSPMQRRLLDEIRKCAENGESYVVKRLFMALRKVCNHPMLLKLLTDPSRKFIQRTPSLSVGIARLQSAGVSLSEEHLLIPSAKMIKLDNMLEQLKREGKRVLIFSNFTSQLDILEGLCALRGYPFERLDGECTRTERELSVIRFNHKKAKSFAFLVTTTAGGVGVTLTGADTVVIFDCHFNPQMDRQAADRAHRIGQTRTVYVYRMCLKGTAEETIQNISNRKAALGDLVLDNSVAKKSDQTLFSLEEIRKMLAASDRGLLDEETPMERELAALVTEGAEEAEASVFDVSRDVKDFTDFRTNICFACGEKMKPLEPLKMCEFCPKGYHLDCLSEEPRKTAKWSCPRHRCMECDKNVTSDGALFLCSSCPKSYCFDCLDPRYVSELDDSGLYFRDISFSYHGMKSEGVEPKRSVYYLTCLECSGIDESETETASSIGELKHDAIDVDDG